MKKLIIMSVLVIGSFSYKAADAQVKVSLNVILGNQPGYSSKGYQQVQYYYLPDYNVYYHVPTKKYTYLQGNRWVNSSVAPRQYRNFDLNRARKVTMNQSSPWLRNQSNVKQYASHNKNVQYYNNSNNNNYNNKKDNVRSSRGNDNNDRYQTRGKR